LDAAILVEHPIYSPTLRHDEDGYLRREHPVKTAESLSASHGLQKIGTPLRVETLSFWGAAGFIPQR
jgi:hypothetical protein